MNSIDGRVGAL